MPRMHRNPIEPDRPFGFPVVEALLAGPASVIASIMLPSIAITIHALWTADAASISRFAVSVAEPLALAGAALVVAGLARRGARRRSPRWRAGLAVGCVAALAMSAAAFWVHDVDAWTAAAALGLPLLGALVARRGSGADAIAGSEAPSDGAAGRATPRAPGVAAPLLDGGPAEVRRAGSPAVPSGSRVAE